MIEFVKMHGVGNDYVYIDGKRNNLREIKDLSSLIVQISDRHKGVGADGVILIENSLVGDAKMVMYNADGSRGKMCGNGIRCVAKYVYEDWGVKRDTLVIETDSGIKELSLVVDDGEVIDVGVAMGKAKLNLEDIPMLGGEKSFIKKEIIVDGVSYVVTCVSMGNPHCVVVGSEIEELDLEKIGPLFENHELFPERVNVEFVELVSADVIKMRVWERGSGETLACGTGACASVVACVLGYGFDYDKEVRVRLSGGELLVTYFRNGEVKLQGEAVKVFRGIWETKDA